MDSLKHDKTRWRWYKYAEKHHLAYFIETDEYKSILMSQLHFVSQWHKDRHPDWEAEFNASKERVEANMTLASAAPRMLEALIAASKGDSSLIQSAIDMAVGKIDWLGKPVEKEVDE